MLTMDMNDILDFLHSTARSVGAEVTSPWFYVQVGMVLAGAGISLAAGAAADDAAGPDRLLLHRGVRRTDAGDPHRHE